jgi:hypothetical protein
MTTVEHVTEGKCPCGAVAMSPQAAAIYAAMIDTCPELWDQVDDDIFWMNRAVRLAARLEESNG